MPKTDRLQLRMDPELKRWYEKYAEPRGGMSQDVHTHVEELYEKETNTPWPGMEEGNDRENATGPGDAGVRDPREDGAGPD